MVDRPVIFSAPMVRALLEGRKSQTRRILKPYNGPSGEGVVIVHEPWGEGMRREIARFKPPYAFGDRLWVRETLTVCSSGLEYAADDEECHDLLSATPHAEAAQALWAKRAHPDGPDVRPTTVSSRFMPRWASRLTLAVTDVRVERLQEISEADARAEGVLYVPGHGEITREELLADPGYSNFLDCRMGFELLWNSIHGPEAWHANPWVVAVSFTTERRNIDAPAKEAI